MEATPQEQQPTNHKRNYSMRQYDLSIKIDDDGDIVLEQEWEGYDNRIVLSVEQTELVSKFFEKARHDAWKKENGIGG